MYREQTRLDIMREFLDSNGFIKMNPYFYAKNIKSNIITGAMILLNLSTKKISVLSISDNILFFKHKPILKISEQKYNNFNELVDIIKSNEKIQVEFIKKDLEWTSSHQKKLNK